MYIKLNKYYFDKCSKFADNQLDTSKNLYAYRGEHRLSKMREDIIVGKLGEVAAYKYLKQRGFNPKRPDFKIYEGRRKSFDADITTECGKLIHVKSQSYDSMVRYGASWLLQKSDKLTFEPKLDEYVLMVNLRGLEANVLGIVSALDLIEYDLFEKPKVERYQKTKLALYFDSIKNSGIKTEAI